MRTTSTQYGGARLNRLLGIKDWSLRSKLTAILLIPTVVAVVLAGGQVNDELELAARADQSSGDVIVLDKTRAVAHALQRERDLATASADTAGLQTRRRMTDAAVAELDAAVREYPAGLATDQRMTEARQRLAGLPAARRAIGRSAFTELTSLTVPLLALTTAASEVTGNASTGQQVAALAATGRLIEQTQFQHTLLASVNPAKALPDNDLTALRIAYARAGDALTDLRDSVSGEQRSRFDTAVDGRLLDRRDQFVEGALARGQAGMAPSLDPGSWQQTSQPVLDQLVSYENNLAESLRASVREMATDAETRSLRDAVLVIGALLVGLLLALYLVRTVTRPLGTLRRRALDVAHRELPAAIERLATTPAAPGEVAVEPVPVRSAEEIGQLARAFDEVHVSAVRLAAEQSILRHSVNEIFIGLSRRTQNLVETQLRMIDTLEADELDPDQLARLFKLDHLATRIRRNSENLLVLAGATIRRSGVQAVTLDDLLQAAVSEIDQYTRVVLKPAPSAVVLGTAVSDVIHLLAELLDNATAFSPPTTQVTLVSSMRPGGEVRLEVVDEGIGLSAATLDDLNRQLAVAGPIEAAMSKQMGLFVVSRLAARTGTQVRLRANAGTGVVAEVTLPSTIVRPDAQRVPFHTAPGRAVRDETPPPPAAAHPITAPSTAVPSTTVSSTTVPPTAGPQTAVPPGAPAMVQAVSGRRDFTGAAPAGLPPGADVQDSGLPKRVPARTPAAAQLGDHPPAMQGLTKAWFKEAVEEERQQTRQWPRRADAAAHLANPTHDYTEAGLPRRRKGELRVPGSFPGQTPDAGGRP